MKNNYTSPNLLLVAINPKEAYSAYCGTFVATNHYTTETPCLETVLQNGNTGCDQCFCYDGPWPTFCDDCE